jgi:hypothetical protein
MFLGMGKVKDSWGDWEIAAPESKITIKAEKIRTAIEL